MNIIDFTEASRRHLRPIAEETARDEVLRRLRGRVTGNQIVKAQAHADRSLRRGVARNVAVARAVSWAICAVTPDDAA